MHSLAILIMGMVMASGEVVFAADDFDAEVEETMAEKDATSVQAQMAREREEKDAREAARLKEEARKTKEQAEARYREVTKELKGLERDIRMHQAEQAQAKKVINKNKAIIADSEARLKSATDRLSKVRSENETLQKMRDEQTTKIADLGAKTTDTKAEIQKVAKKLADVQADFAKGQAELKATQAKLTAAETEHARIKAKTDAELQRLRETHKANKEKADRIEADIKAREKANARMEQSVKQAQEEIANQERHLSSMPSARMTLARDCEVFEKPNGKVLGTKKAGSAVTGSANDAWVTYTLKDRRQVFMPKACFAGS